MEKLDRWVANTDQLEAVKGLEVEVLIECNRVRLVEAVRGVHQGAVAVIKVRLVVALVVKKGYFVEIVTSRTLVAVVVVLEEHFVAVVEVIKEHLEEVFGAEGLLVCMASGNLEV